MINGDYGNYDDYMASPEAASLRQAAEEYALNRSWSDVEIVEAKVVQWGAVVTTTEPERFEIEAETLGFEPFAPGSNTWPDPLQQLF